MRLDEHTSIGGAGRSFQTTQWTAIEQARRGNNAQKNALIGELLKSYWKPVYCYLRRKGYDNEEAKDLTQGFFHEVVLSRRLIQQAERAKGRLRTLLLTALDRYITSIHRKQTARKRIPKGKLIQLEQISSGDLPESFESLGSEESFNYVWISELLDRMLEELEAECRAHKMTIHWQLFNERVLFPILEGTEPPTLARLCEKYDISEKAAASNMIFAVKRRFQAAFRRQLRQSVATDAEVAEEIRELMQFLIKKSQ